MQSNTIMLHDTVRHAITPRNLIKLHQACSGADNSIISLHLTLSIFSLNIEFLFYDILYLIIGNYYVLSKFKIVGLSSTTMSKTLIECLPPALNFE